jgi:hypothetical protein
MAVGGELSLVKFGVFNFFAVILNKYVFSPSQTTLCEIARSIIEAEPKMDAEAIKMKEQIEFIYNNTDEKVMQPLSLVELAVFKNMDKGLNKQIEIGDKEFYISELYKYLEKIRWKLVIIVIQIAKKYTLELPIASGFGTGMKMAFGFNEGGEIPQEVQ